MTDPRWTDSRQGDLLELVAQGSPTTPSADEEWRIYVDALQIASQLDCGPIRPNRLRPLVRDRVSSKRRGAFVSRAVSEKLIEPTDDWEVSDDREGRNAGRPARIYIWVGDADRVRASLASHCAEVAA
jgi:hypothetical protein